MLHLALPTDTSGAHTHFNVKIACARKGACPTCHWHVIDMSLTCHSLHGHIPGRPWNVESRKHKTRQNTTIALLHSTSFSSAMSAMSSPCRTSVALPHWTCWTQGQSVESRTWRTAQASPCARLMVSPFFKGLQREFKRSKEMSRVKIDKIVRNSREVLKIFQSSNCKGLKQPEAISRLSPARNFRLQKFAAELSHVERYSWASGRNLACGTLKLKKKVLDGSSPLVPSSAVYTIGRKSWKSAKALDQTCTLHTSCNTDNILWPRITWYDLIRKYG